MMRSLLWAFNGLMASAAFSSGMGGHWHYDKYTFGRPLGAPGANGLLNYQLPAVLNESFRRVLGRPGLWLLNQSTFPDSNLLNCGKSLPSFA